MMEVNCLFLCLIMPGICFMVTENRFSGQITAERQIHDAWLILAPCGPRKEDKHREQFQTSEKHQE